MKWIGTVADKALLVKFFQLQNPAVAALWWNLTLGQFPNPEQCSVLLHVGLEVREGEWFRNRVDTNFLSLCIKSGQNGLAERIVDIWASKPVLRDAYRNQPFGAQPHQFNWEENQCLQFVQLLAEVRKRDCISSKDFEFHLYTFITELHNHQVSCVRWILDASAKGVPGFEWIPAHVQELGRCLPRQHLPCLSSEIWASFRFAEIPCLVRWIQNGGWIECLTMVWTLYDAARNGKQTLQRQILSMFSHSSQKREISLELVLSVAVDMADIETMRTLLEYGVSPNTDLLCPEPAPPNMSTWTLDALSRAAQKFNVEILALLINHGADIERKRPLALQGLLKQTASQIALSDPPPSFRQDIVLSWATIMFLLEPHGSGLEEGTMPNIPMDPFTLLSLMVYLERLEEWQIITSHQYVKLFMRLFPIDTVRNAIRAGCSAMAMNALLSSGLSINPNGRDQGRTMLHDVLVTPYKDRHRIVEILLQHGADPALDSNGLTTLEATLRGSLTIGWRFTRLEYQDGWRPFLDQSLALLQTLLRLGAQVPARKSRLFALLIAHQAPLSTIQQIMGIGPQSTPFGAEYSRVLVFAIGWGQFEIAEWMIEHGVDVNAGTHRGRNALQTACHEAPIPFIRLLIQKGANIEGSSKDWGETPLQVAASTGCTETAGLLLSHNANVNAPGKRGQWDELPMNALEWAASHGQLDMVKFLVDCGAHSSWQNLTKFDGAFFHGRAYLGVIKFLEYHTGCSYSQVMSSTKVKFPSLMDAPRFGYPPPSELGEEDWQAEPWAQRMN